MILWRLWRSKRQVGSVRTPFNKIMSIFTLLISGLISHAVYTIASTLVLADIHTDIIIFIRTCT